MSEKFPKELFSHHFNILVAPNTNFLDFTEEFKIFVENDLKIVLKNNSNFHVLNFQKLLIDDVRMIINRAIVRSASSDKKIFLITFDSITEQAQNALLKIIEEAPNNTYINLVVSRTDNFLPTVLSRSIIYNTSDYSLSEYSNKTSKEFEFDQKFMKDFLKKTAGDRMKFIVGFAEQIHDGKLSRSLAEDFIKMLIIYFHADLKKSSKNSPEIGKEHRQNIQQLQKIYDYLKDPSASTKILLERAVLMI